MFGTINSLENFYITQTKVTVFFSENCFNLLFWLSETFFTDFYSCALQPEELCIQTYTAGERLNKIKFVILLLDRICIIWNCLDQVVRKLNVLF